MLKAGYSAEGKGAYSAGSGVSGWELGFLPQPPSNEFCRGQHRHAGVAFSRLKMAHIPSDQCLCGASNGNLEETNVVRIRKSCGKRWSRDVDSFPLDDL